MPYVDFEYYTNVFGGSLLSESAFLSCAEKAQAYVDYLTLGRAASNLSENVKKAVCAAAEVVSSSSDTDGIKSENNDGYSVTYFETNSEMSRVSQCVRVYLEPTGLLYCAINAEA